MSPALQSVLVVSVVGSLGLFIGHIRVSGVKIGIAGVLFAGVIAGHFGAVIPADILDFLRDFGLILFIYMVGLQVGPGFLSTFRNEGRLLVPMAVGIVLIGTVLGALLHFVLGIPVAGTLGILAGATTNTPSLAAAREVLGQGGDELLGIGYAISYPGAVIGLILTMTIFKRGFRIEIREDSAAVSSPREGLSSWSIKVENVNLHGLSLSRLPALSDLGIVISRIEGKDGLQVATSDSVIHVGDTIVAVGSESALSQFCLIVGRRSSEDLTRKPSSLAVRNLVVTDTGVNGKTLRDLEVLVVGSYRFTRVRRGDVEFPATEELELQRGDTLRVVSDEEALERLGKALGNTPRALETFNFLPLFVGIGLGVAFGLYEFNVPGLPSSVKLGLAGGPLCVALILSRFTNSNNFPTYVPYGANIALRELGMLLFLAAVGLKAGPGFVEALFSTNGVIWVCCGLVVTVLPLLIVLIPYRRKVSFLLLCGLAAGSLTDPPALAFASSLSPSSNEPSVAYATVYPFAMVLRILCIQIAALLML